MPAYRQAAIEKVVAVGLCNLLDRRRLLRYSLLLEVTFLGGVVFMLKLVATILRAMENYGSGHQIIPNQRMKLSDREMPINQSAFHSHAILTTNVHSTQGTPLPALLAFAISLCAVLSAYFAYILR